MLLIRTDFLSELRFLRFNDFKIIFSILSYNLLILKILIQTISIPLLPHSFFFHFFNSFLTLFGTTVILFGGAAALPPLNLSPAFARHSECSAAE
jgi:hypothetical protein